MTGRDARNQSALRWGLGALADVYGHVARARRSWYDRPSARRCLPRPVISVGNLVVGGSGKTPVVAALARLLGEMGERPAILSRGYARRRHVEGIVVVSDGETVHAGVDESGDEPQMLARNLPDVPVLVGADRYLAGVLACQRFDPSVLILDDGFQHLQLARDVDLLLVSPRDLDDAVVPAGMLREPVSAARAADAVLVVGAGAEETGRMAAALGVPIAYTVTPCYLPLRPLNGADVRDVRRVVAVAGIARPARFAAALQQRGYDVVEQLRFRDHHWYTPADVRRVYAAARRHDADAIVTTEKDEVRLRALLARDDGIAGWTWAVLPMDVTVEPHAAFVAWLRTRLEAARTPA